MPTYDFTCQTCATRFTITQNTLSTPTTPKCANCQEPMLRIFSAPPVSFKGKGWGKDR